MADQAPGNGQGAEGTGAAAAGTPASTAGAAATPPAQPAAQPIAWLEGADPALVGYVQNKGWEQPVQVLESYQNLEKLLGADRAGHTVVLPKPGAPQTEVDAFYNRLGRPADPTGYKIAIPEVNGDAEFGKVAAGWFHELGLSKDQGEKLAEKFNGRIGELTKAQTDGLAAKNLEQQTALKTAWGAAFNQNVEVAAAAARGLGIDKPTLDALDQVLGFDKTMQLFHTMGARVTEPDFVSGNGPSGFGAALTPGQAQAKILELRGDKNWVARLTNHDAAAQAEWTQLHKWAHPEESNG